MKIPIFIVCSTILLTGCLGLQKKDRQFFADKGISIGKPQLNEDNSVFIPISFKTRIVHSAQWLYDIKWVEKDGRITLTALFSVPPNNKKSIYEDGIRLEPPLKNQYEFVYRDPDGKTHELGVVTIAEKENK